VIATIAGTSFGAFGEGHLRFSYAASMGALQEAVGRIGDWLGRQNMDTTARSAG
jgi:aspartate aminotransferase